MRWRLALLMVLTTVGTSKTVAQQSAERERRRMPVREEGLAVAIARAHIEAWSHHDWDRARGALAAGVHVTATTTQPMVPATDLTGVDDYMTGLIKFAQGVEPGSAKVISAVGDEHNALIMLRVQASFGPAAPPVPLFAARLYLIDDNKEDRVGASRLLHRRINGGDALREYEAL